MPKKHAAEWLFGEGEPHVVAISHSRNKQRAVLRLSDSSTIRLSMSALSIAQITEGTPIGLHARKRIVDAESVAEVVRRAVRLLAASPKSSEELRDCLLAKDMDERLVARALEYVRAKGLLDDSAIADRLVETTQGSRALVRAKLEARRLGASEIERALGQKESDRVAALAAAREIVSKFSPTMPAMVRQRRLLAALVRKGFDEEASIDAARRVLPRFMEVDESQD